MGAALIAGAACRQPAPPPPRFKPTSPLQTVRAAAHGGQDLRLLVDEGDAESAADYARYIEQELGFPVEGTLDDLLRFCGFDKVTGQELETRASHDLMASYPDRLLASRFFAPKIGDVSGIGGPAASKDLGWRKLVRLTVPPDAPAAARGIAAAYLLFNVFQPRVEIGSDPFEPCSRMPSRCSANNQVILVPQTVPSGRDALFWLVFENAAAGGKRTDHLNATFDGGDEASRSGGNPVKSYFLPDACAQCHGGRARMDRFVREARSASALNHPNIITIYEIGESNGTHFIATEFIDGKTLTELARSQALDYRFVLDVATQVASALDEAHSAGIVHRDIKPDNVMVRANGLAKLLDFGIAKLSAPSDPGDDTTTVLGSQTHAGVLIGTPQFMSPEQARGLRVDHQTDIFSLGVVMHHLLSGQSPFAGDTVSDALAAVLTREPPTADGSPGGDWQTS